MTTADRAERMERITDQIVAGVRKMQSDIRLNGQSLWCSADDPVIVHKTSTRGDDVVRVTLTLLARRVVYGTEADVTPDEEKP